VKSFWCVLVLLALSIGCATVKAHDPFRNPDGTLNVRKVELFAKQGFEALCQPDQQTFSATVCADGFAAFNAIDAISTNDPVLLIKSILTILQTTAHNHPELDPVFAWVYPILQAASQAIP